MSFFLPRGYSFCREVISFATRLFFLPWAYSSCRELILFAVRFFFSLRLILLTWQLWATILTQVGLYNCRYLQLTGSGYIIYMIGLLITCVVKSAWYWPFFCMLMDHNKVRFLNMQKSTRWSSNHLDKASLIKQEFITIKEKGHNILVGHSM